MHTHVVALPMYDWPEARGETDAEWARISAALRAAGVDAPIRLARCNADLPAVPGGIRDAEGRPIAPDPATLPPDDLDLATLWRHPALLLAQTCWGPMESGLQEHVQVVGQPDYSAYQGGAGPLYSSAILMRSTGIPPSALPGISPSREEIIRYDGSHPVGTGPKEGPGSGEGVISLLEGEMPGRAEGGVPPPASGAPLIPVLLLRGKRFAYNDSTSLSGFLGLKKDLEAAGEGLSIFSDSIETGAHRLSVRAVAEGRADVAAIDCRSLLHCRRFEPAAAALEVVGWTARRPGLPFVTSRLTPPERVALLRRVLGHVLYSAVRPLGRTKDAASY
jgi:ABC-type phosphate/phosphonate transport system substrate-binding protein